MNGAGICVSDIGALHFFKIFRLEFWGVLGLKRVLEVLLHWKKDWLLPILKVKQLSEKRVV